MIGKLKICDLLKRKPVLRDCVDNNLKFVNIHLKQHPLIDLQRGKAYGINDYVWITVMYSSYIIIKLFNISIPMFSPSKVFFTDFFTCDNWSYKLQDYIFFKMHKMRESITNQFINTGVCIYIYFII